MPRPKLKSDDEVLEAATVVLKRCGPIEFTLSGGLCCKNREA